MIAGLTGFIEGRLRLKVNESKSAVARPEARHFLGFRLRVDPQSETVEVLLSERSKRNAMERIRQLTPRNWGGSLDRCIAQVNAWLRGWHRFFGIASPSEQYTLRALDAHVRRRLRAIMLRHCASTILWEPGRATAPATRQVRWSARRNEQVVLRLLRGESLGSARARDGAAGRPDCRLARGVPSGSP